MNEEGSKQTMVGFGFGGFLEKSVNSLLLEAKGIVNLV